MLEEEFSLLSMSFEQLQNYIDNIGDNRLVIIGKVCNNRYYFVYEHRKPFLLLNKYTNGKF
jgi:hypothetical protein